MGTTLLKGLINHGYWPLTSPGMILQVQDSHHDEVNNYANVDLICKVAKAEKVDAVWPGVSGKEFQQTCLQLWLVNPKPAIRPY